MQRASGRKVAAVAAAVLIAAGASAPAARADGDPASDILLVSTVFLPQDAGIPPQQQAQLLALTKEARTAGVPVRVAIVSSKFDLGSVPELFGKPQQYAQFLGAELSFVYRGRLLVVMPEGVGVYWNKHSTIPGADALKGLTPGTGGARLAAAGLTGTQTLATAAGHRLKAPSGVASAAGTGASSHHSGAMTWIVLFAGVALIALASAISIRLRPLWRKSGPAESGSRRRG
jgi:hypothetical protein